MLEPTDAEYFRLREAEERRLAAQAPASDIAAIHNNLANRYAERLSADAAPGPSDGAQARTMSGSPRRV